MKLRTFLIGLAWAGLGALTPVGSILLDDLHRGSPMDWPQTRRIAVFNSLVGIAAYWRKHVALLKLPPDWQEAILEQPPAKQAGG